MIPEALEKILVGQSESDRKMVIAAYQAAEEQLRGRERGNGAPFIEHPLGVAEIVSKDLGLKADAITAIFLHEGNRFHGDNANAVNNSELIKSWETIFPAEIIEMAKELNKISFIKMQETNLDEERYRKLIISFSKDPRVILIKLADRLEVMRHLDIFPPSKRQGKIMETILLYAPIAHQLGLYRVKSEMEDLFLRYSEPEQYRLINNSLKATEKDREQIASQFIEPLKEKLDKSGISYHAKVRTKSAYSIWKKMQAQKVSFEQIFDVFAMRFIIDAPADRKTEHELCWKVYSLVTEEYQPDTSRLRDWLSNPKSNGYESLHTTVCIEDGKFIEVQIRTARMDFEAEQGDSSHWSYKGVQSDQMLSKWLNRLRDMMLDGHTNDYTLINENILGEVYVFTPKGELRQLRKGASVLDFAFDVHSNIGCRCTGGRINGRMVSIREKLKTGDAVEVITSKNQKPTREWLKWTVTSKARTKIRQFLNKEEEKLKEAEAKPEVKKIEPEPIPEPVQHIQIPQQPQKETGVLIIGEKALEKVSYKMSKCCDPKYGDEVFGFLSIKDGLKIHKMSCPNAYRLLNDYPYRVQKVRWKEKIKEQ